MTRDYAYKMIAASIVIENVSSNVDQGIQKPETERQTRPLSKLKPEEQLEIINEKVHHL